MTDPIEARLLRLAEKATPGPWHDGDFTNSPDAVVLADDRLRHHIAEMNDLPDDLGSPWANAAFIAALDPATVSRLARVVEAARAMSGMTRLQAAFYLVPREQYEAMKMAVAALDAEQEENRP